MTARAKAFGTLAGATIVAFIFAWLLTPWADLVAVILVIGIAATSTLFAAGYMFTAPWWQTWIGRALLMSSTSLALLADVSLLYQWLGDDYALRDAVRLTVFSLILAGSTLKCVALVFEKFRARTRP